MFLIFTTIFIAFKVHPKFAPPNASVGIDIAARKVLSDMPPLPLLNQCKISPGKNSIIKRAPQSSLMKLLQLGLDNLVNTVKKIGAKKATQKLELINYQSFMAKESKSKYLHSKINFVAFVDLITKRIRHIYFLNGSHFDNHQSFIRSLPGYKNLPAPLIEQLSLNKKNRAFYFGSIIEPEDPNYIQEKEFSVLSSSSVSYDHILELYQKLGSSIDPYLVKKLIYRSYDRQNISETSTGWPLNAPMEFRPKIKTQNEFLLTPNKWSVGRVLRIDTVADYRSALQSSLIRANSLLVLNHYPIEIPPVAGVIFSQLAGTFAALDYSDFKNSVIPVVYQKDGFSNNLKLQADNQWLYLSTQFNEFDLISISSSEAQKLSYLANSNPFKMDLLADPKFKKILLLKKVSPTSKAKYGLRITSIARLQAPSSQYPVPSGIAVPMHYYRNFVNNTPHPVATNKKHLSLEHYIISKLDAIDSEGVPLEMVNQQLIDIRQAIQKKTMPNNAWIRNLKIKIDKTYFSAGISKVLLSPSPNFNMNASYNSTAFPLKFEYSKGQTTEELSIIIKKVWSSLFLNLSYWYIKHQSFQFEQLGMAILIQPKHNPPAAVGFGTTGPYRDMGGDLAAQVKAFPASALMTPQSTQAEISRVTMTWDENLEFKIIRPASYMNRSTVTAVLLSSYPYTDIYYRMQNIYTELKSELLISPNQHLNFNWSWAKNKNDEYEIQLTEMWLRELPTYITKSDDRSQQDPPPLVVVGKEPIVIESLPGEFNDVLVVMNSQVQVKIAAQSFYLAADQNYFAKIPRLRLKWGSGLSESIALTKNDFQYSESNVKIKYQEKGLSWGKRIRKLKIHIHSKHMPTLKLILSTENIKNLSAHQADSKVISLASVKFNFLAEALDFPHLIKHPKCSTFNIPVTQILWTGRVQEKHLISNMPKSHSPIAKAVQKAPATSHAIAQGLNDNVSVYIKWQKSNHPRSREAFKHAIQRIKISGLFPIDLATDFSNATVHLPSANNLEWQYAIDLNRFQNYTLKFRRKMINHIGGQFLILDSGAADPFAMGGDRPMTLQVWNKEGTLTRFIPMNKDQWFPQIENKTSR